MGFCGENGALCTVLSQMARKYLHEPIGSNPLPTIVQFTKTYRGLQRDSTTWGSVPHDMIPSLKYD